MVGLLYEFPHMSRNTVIQLTCGQFRLTVIVGTGDFILFFCVV